MHYCTIQIQCATEIKINDTGDKPYFVTDNRTFIIETDRYSVSWKWAIHVFPWAVLN